MSEKMKNLIVRSISGVVLLIVVVCAVMFSWWSLAALLVAITIGGQVELYRLLSKTGHKPNVALGCIAGVALVGAAFTTAQALQPDAVMSFSDVGFAVTTLCQIVFIISVPLIVAWELFSHSTRPLQNISATVLAPVYIALPLAFAPYLITLLSNGEWNPLVFLYFIFIIWANDVFAYLFGVSLGRHKMCERISPKKSWEGFAGGLLGAMAMGALGAYLSQGSYWIWCGLGLVAALGSVVGDLVESMFKRAAEVKDSGSIMPGHGGWLDRFDSWFVALPVSVVYLYIIAKFI